MAKKLLDRFENSPKVWTIKQSIDTNGNTVYEPKIYNSIADAHRDNPKISCSHIEDYCNATFFTRKNHWFAYVGYRMAPSIQELMFGYSNQAINPVKKGICIYDSRLEHILLWSDRMWQDIITKFIGKTYQRVLQYPSNNAFYGDSIIAKALTDNLSSAPRIMKGLYTNGWNNGEINQYVKEWCVKNLTHNSLLITGDGVDDEVKAESISIKPEKRYWCTQEYKQQNYL